MKKFKMKLHEWKQELSRLLSEAKKNAKKLKKKVRMWAIKKLLKFERKMGWSLRCQFCPDNFECPAFDFTRRKDFFKPQRCSERISER